MPLILAVEPDARQAARIAAVLRERPRTHLVIAQAAAPALDALADRIPDLLLTSPLLSQRDEAALAIWLQGLGPMATRVQALTIPILAGPQPAAAPRSVLSVLRGRHPRSSSPDGCEPSMFAEQVGIYLDRTSTKWEMEPQLDLDLDPPQEVQPTLESQPALEIQSASEIELPLESEPALEVVAALAPMPEESAPWLPVPLDDLCDAPVGLPEPFETEPGSEHTWELSPVSDIEAVIAVPLQRAATPFATTRRPRVTNRAKNRISKQKPMYDDSEFFDPALCGFATLIAKLDEITDEEDDDRTRTETTIHLDAH